MSPLSFPEERRGSRALERNKGSGFHSHSLAELHCSLPCMIRFIILCFIKKVGCCHLVLALAVCSGAGVATQSSQKFPCWRSVAVIPNLEILFRNGHFNEPLLWHDRALPFSRGPAAPPPDSGPRQSPLSSWPAGLRVRSIDAPWRADHSPLQTVQ